MIQNKTLHLLNGMEMYKYFKKTRFLEKELMIPFNEAMCYGNTCEELFSGTFNETRAKVHHVTLKQYAEITLKPLKPLFELDFNQIVLWFDEDMFCQINLLTILAWLDQSEYRGGIGLQIVRDTFQPVESFNLEPNGYSKIYKQVMVQKEAPDDIYPSPLRKGIELYLNYLNKESDLILFIEKHNDVPVQKLVLLLIENFKHYGLGDTQYMEIIESYRNNLL